MDLLTHITPRGSHCSFRSRPEEMKPSSKLPEEKQPAHTFEMVQVHKTAQVSHKHNRDPYSIPYFSMVPSFHSCETPERPATIATTFEIPYTDRRPARVLIIIRDRPLPTRRDRPTARDLYSEDDTSITPEEYLRQNEPTAKSKKEEEEFAAYDRLYNYKPQVATRRTKDHVVTSSVDKVTKVRGRNFNVSMKDGEQGYGLGAVLGYAGLFYPAETDAK